MSGSDISQAIARLENSEPEQLLSGLESMRNSIVQLEYHDFKGRSGIVLNLCGPAAFKKLRHLESFQTLVSDLLHKMFLTVEERGTSYAALERVLAELFQSSDEGDEDTLAVKVMEDILPRSLNDINTVNVANIFSPTNTRQSKSVSHEKLRLRIASLLSEECARRGNDFRRDIGQKLSDFVDKNYDGYDATLACLYASGYQGAALFGDIVADLYRRRLYGGGNRDDDALTYMLSRITQITDVCKQARQRQSAITNLT